MDICFVLPGFTRQPIGGYKIVFEYANRLQQDGNKISIVFLNDDKLQKIKVPFWGRRILVNCITAIEPRWFPLSSNIIKISSFQKKYLDKVKESDVVFATGIQTVEVVKNNFKNSRKFYLIQGYENWGVTEEYLRNTYGYFNNIVVSNWLKDIVDRYADKSSQLLKNPIDIDVYRRMRHQTQRKNHTIGILYHTDEIKGVRYAMEAIYRLKEKYSDLTVQMFGMFPKPKNLPKWISYKQGASQKETVDIYNNVQVFLCASIEEGYGLTGLEAMACGACLVSTAYKGVLEYAKDGYNALLSPVKDVNKIVQNISKLFNDSNERIRISNNGVNSVKSYSWEKTMKKMYKILQENIENEYNT